MQPTDSAYKAAKEALYGKDPTNEAILLLESRYSYM